MRVANGPEPGAYFHKYFLRDQPQLAAQMFCKNARTMLAMNSNSSIVIPPEMKTREGTANVPVKQTQPSTEAPTPVSVTTAGIWSMKMKSATPLPKLHFSTASNSGVVPRNVGTDHHAMLMQQEKEQLNRMLIERALRLQQRSSVVMQQDRLLQMRRMIEMNMHQHRLQQQQKVICQQKQECDSSAARILMNNRASAA